MAHHIASVAPGRLELSANATLLAAQRHVASRRSPVTVVPPRELRVTDKLPQRDAGMVIVLEIAS
jgi:hypothetical protein